jgi:hypothetical protein
MKSQKFSHKTPHLKGKQHQLDPNLDVKQLVKHATVQYVDWDNDGDVDEYDKKPKLVPDENPTANFATTSKKLIAKEKGEIKHTKRGMAYEDLRKWFGTGGEGGVGGGGWDRYNTKGERIGKCAREPGEPKPKCLSREKAAKMSKDEIAAAVKRKREKDPVADRPGKGGKPIMSSNKIDEGLLDRLKGRKEIGRTASGGKIYQSIKPQKSNVTYGGKTQDEIRRENQQKKVDASRKKKVESGQYDDPWLKSSPAAERRVHLQQLRGEEMEEKRYCIKCKKMETRNQCSYGPEMWDKMTIKNFQESTKRKEPDHEHSMIRSELETIKRAADRLKKKMKGEGNVEAWVQSKITKAADYIDAAADYIDSGEHNVHNSMDEEKNKCPEGQYFCNRENKCKPIPKGYHLMPNGAIMKDSEMKEAKDPCWTGYKQVGMKKKNGKEVPNCVPEEFDLEEENKPTNPKLWAKWKAKAKAKFDVYPSAYANGWAAKGYKSEGGGWKSVSEETIEDLNGDTFVEIIDLIKPDQIEQVEEAVRIPSKTGNIILVTLNWRGKYFMIKLFFPQTTKPNRQEVQSQIEKVYPGSKVQSYYVSDIKPGEQFLQVEDWQKVNRQDKTDGLSQKAVNAYRRENPGSKLQTAVTEKKPTGKRAERRKSFCRRMEGMKSKLTSAETARDPDSRINKALRRWNCN